jgi:hypothetical protein
VTERGDGLCDDCGDGRDAANQQMWDEYAASNFDMEDMEENLPKFEPMSRGPKGRAKSRRDGDPGQAVTITNRLGQSLQYREHVVTCKATHANGRERQISAARTLGRSQKQSLAF